MATEIPEFDLDLERRKLWRGKIRGVPYVLVDPDEGTVSRLRNKAQKAMRLAGVSQEGGLNVVGFDGSAELNAELLAACLRPSEEGGHRFTPEEIARWPAAQVARLVEILERRDGAAPGGGGQGEGGEGNPAPPPGAA